MRDDQNPFEVIFDLFATRLNDAPGHARLARLARTAARIPETLLTDVARLVIRIDDDEFIGDDIAVSLFGVSHCDEKYSDATAFVTELGKRLQRYIDNPLVADNARAVLRERSGWWSMALGRAAALRTWPALVITEKM